MAKNVTNSLSNCSRLYFDYCHNCLSPQSLSVNVSDGAHFAHLRQRQQDVIKAFFKFIEACARMTEKPVDEPDKLLLGKKTKEKSERRGPVGTELDSSRTQNGSFCEEAATQPVPRSVPTKTSPNHFVCLRISNPVIHQGSTCFSHACSVRGPPECVYMFG